jgi:hypothetical protein
LIRLFDESSDRDWLELIRDVAATANSGGGNIAFRLNRNQPPANTTTAATVHLTRSGIVKRLGEFTGSPFDDIHVAGAGQGEPDAAVVTIGRALFPMVFGKAGRCVDAANPGKSVEVFPAGSIFFRHENNTGPGSTDDLRTFFERLLRRIRRRWLAGIRHVLDRPIDVLSGRRPARPARRSEKATSLQPVRITTDPDAPALQPQDVERLYPWRQKDLLQELNSRLGRRALTTYDIQAVRRHHRLDERHDFVFHLAGAGRRYGPVAADWFMEQHARDPEFFTKARAADQEMLKLRRQKPK